jgi:hypothetical protein
MSHTFWTDVSIVLHAASMTHLTGSSVRRFDGNAAAGVVGIGLLFAALFLPGPPPKSSDSVAHLTQVLVDERSVLLVGMWIAGLGGAAVLWFLGAVHRHLASNDADREATAAAAGGVVGVVLIWCGMAMSAALALGVARSADDALIRAATDLGNILIELSKFGLAVLITATCLGGLRRTSMPRRAVRYGMAASALLVATALPPFLADHGFWQFGGPPEIGGGLPAVIWIAWLSVHLARPAREPDSELNAHSLQGRPA